MIRTLSLIVASISFIIVIGGATYEHLAVVPVWSSAVPASLAMFQGPYALKAINFWIPIHPVTITLLAVALFLNWRSESRKFILTTLGGYLAIIGLTALYFVPELMAITQTTYADFVNSELTARARRWELLSLVRLCTLLCLSVTLLFGLTRINSKAVSHLK